MAKTNTEWIVWHLEEAHKFMSNDSIHYAERVGYGLSAIEQALKRLGKPTGIGYPVTHMNIPDELKRFGPGDEEEGSKETAGAAATE